MKSLDQPRRNDMGTREHKVEAYLKEQIEATGGACRKWVSPGRDGVPDQIVMIPMTAGKMIENLKKVPPSTTICQYYLVEIKTLDGVVSEMQAREHTRLRKMGCKVSTAFGHIGVDKFINDIEP